MNLSLNETMNLSLLLYSKKGYAVFLVMGWGDVVDCIESAKFAFDKKQFKKMASLVAAHVFSKEEAEEQYISVEQGILTSELREFLANDLGELSGCYLGVANETLKLQISDAFKFPCLCNPVIVDMCRFLTLQAGTFIDPLLSEMVPTQNVEVGPTVRGDGAGLLQTNRDNVEKGGAKKSGVGRPSTSSTVPKMEKMDRVESSEIARLNRDYMAVGAAIVEMRKERAKLNMQRERRRRAEVDMTQMNHGIESVARELGVKIEKLEGMRVRLREHIESIQVIYIKVLEEWMTVSRVLQWYEHDNPNKISSSMVLVLYWRMEMTDQDYIKAEASRLFNLDSITEERKSPQREDTGQYTQLKRYI